MKRFILGILLGLAVSSLRAQPGQSLFEFPAAAPLTRYGLRALAMLSCAVALFHARSLFNRRNQNLLLLPGIAIGFVVHGLFLLPLLSSPCTILMAAAAVAPPLLARLLRRGTQEPIPDERALGMLPLIGIATCATGVLVALEGTARQVRLLGSNASLDDTIFGGVFLILAAFGGVAFGRPLGQMRRDWGRGRAVEVALVASALLTLVSQRVLVTVSSSGGLRQFMRSYGQEAVDNGMFGYDGILAVAVWIAPAFALGAGIACTRRASELTALAGGTGAGYLALLIADEVTHVEMIRGGILIAAVGGLVASALRPRRQDGLPIAVALVFVVTGLVSAFVVTPQPTMIHAPWMRFRVNPSLVLQTSAGQIAVSPGGADLDVVSLDGVQVTPNLAQATADRDHIVAAVDALDSSSRTDGFDVLLIGQLTPGRAITLIGLGARRIDRTGAWHDSMPRLEAKLFAERGHNLPPGEILTPGQARDRLDAFDLVLSPPVKGPAPLIPTDFEVDPEGRQRIVLWADAGYGIHRRNLGGPVILSGAGIEDLAVGLVYPPTQQDSGVGSLFAPFPASDRMTGWRDGLLRSPRRHQVGLASFTRALADSNSDGPHGKFADGLARHHAAQRRSSIFESPEQRVEISDEALRLMFEGLNGETRPGFFARQVWEEIGVALAAKRDIRAAYEYLEPLAERWAPWPELDLALATADMESLEPEDAIERLRGLDDMPSSLKAKALDLTARAQAEIGDHRGASQTLRKLGELAPSHWQHRQLGIEATLAEEPDGPEILAEILLEDPEDHEVRALLESGIAPAPPGSSTSGHLNHDH